MCLATVYVERPSGAEEVMREVAWVQPEADGLRLVTLMGESQLLQAEILRIDLLHSRILLRDVGQPAAPSSLPDGSPLT